MRRSFWIALFLSVSTSASGCTAIGLAIYKNDALNKIRSSTQPPAPVAATSSLTVGSSIVEVSSAKEISLKGLEAEQEYSLDIEVQKGSLTSVEVLEKNLSSTSFAQSAFRTKQANSNLNEGECSSSYFENMTAEYLPNSKTIIKLNKPLPYCSGSDREVLSVGVGGHPSIGNGGAANLPIWMILDTYSCADIEKINVLGINVARNYLLEKNRFIQDLNDTFEDSPTVRIFIKSPCRVDLDPIPWYGVDGEPNEGSPEGQAPISLPDENSLTVEQKEQLRFFLENRKEYFIRFNTSQSGTVLKASISKIVSQLNDAFVKPLQRTQFTGDPTLKSDLLAWSEKNKVSLVMLSKLRQIHPGTSVDYLKSRYSLKELPEAYYVEYEKGMLVLYKDRVDQSALITVRGAIFDKWKQMGYKGNPFINEEKIANSSISYQIFSSGVIYTDTSTNATDTIVWVPNAATSSVSYKAPRTQNELNTLICRGGSPAEPGTAAIRVRVDYQTKFCTPKSASDAAPGPEILLNPVLKAKFAEGSAKATVELLQQVQRYTEDVASYRSAVAKNLEDTITGTWTLLTNPGTIANDLNEARQFVLESNGFQARYDREGEAFWAGYLTTLLAAPDPADLTQVAGGISKLAKLTKLVKIGRLETLASKVFSPGSKLQKIARSAIQTYRALDDLTKGLRGELRQEIHHIIEQRFLTNRFKWSKSDIDTKVPAILLDEADHQVFTNRWRQELGYGGDVRQDANYVPYQTITKERLIEASNNVYADYPELREAAINFLKTLP